MRQGELIAVRFRGGNFFELAARHAWEWRDGLPGWAKRLLELPDVPPLILRDDYGFEFFMPFISRFNLDRIGPMSDMTSGL